MTRCWIRKPGASRAAGPFSLEQLRDLRSAGLLTGDAEASLSVYEGFRVIAAWPELVKSLDTPGAKAIAGDGSPQLGESSATRQRVPDTAGPESLVPEEKSSSLKLGRAVFDDANAADKTEALDTVGMLRANVESEADRPLKFPPWYKSPGLRNWGRFAVLAAIAGMMIRYGWPKLKSAPFIGVPMVSAGGLVLGGGAFVIFFLMPARWED